VGIEENKTDSFYGTFLQEVGQWRASEYNKNLILLFSGREGASACVSQSDNQPVIFKETLMDKRISV